MAGLLLLGVTLCMGLATLPLSVAAAGGLVLGGVLAFRRRLLPRSVGLVLAGFCLAVLHGHHAMGQRIDAGHVGVDLDVMGEVVGLVRPGSPVTRFELRLLAVPGAPELVGRRVGLAWYGAAPELVPGERWAMQVRLRRPRGVLNPAGFDSERRALERRLAATGYVRDAGPATRLAPARGLDAWRQQASERVAAAAPGEAVRYVQALALGDTRGLSAADWEALRNTGLSHLLAISGFHVGVVAGLGAVLAGWLSRLWPPLLRRCPRPMLMAFAALALALGYAAAAGFSLPTRRALLMIAAALLARVLRRPVDPWNSLALAMLAVLAVDPLAVLSAGFWLSFLGVGWLLWCLADAAGEGYARALLRAQWVATLGLLPLTAWFFGHASLAGPLANLVGVPLVTLLVVPLSLLGTALEAMAVGLGRWPLALAVWLIGVAEPWMQALSTRAWAARSLPPPGLAAFALALAGVAVLLLPRGVPGRWLAPLLVLPLLWPRLPAPPAGGFDLELIDVGQGLSVLVRTRGHALVYDFGPRPPGGRDMGQAAVLPVLRARGLGRVDALVLSHDDNDHDGGLPTVHRAFPDAPVFGQQAWLPRAGRLLPEQATRRACLAGEGWHWDGVDFEFLHPTPYFPDVGNEGSCVLRVEGRFGSALLTGDVGEVVERRLMRLWPDRLPADLLVLGHHGSRHSSSPAFLDAVAPRHALNASGHRSRFNHPHPDVLQRLAERAIPLSDTGEHGHLRATVRRDGVAVTRWREAGRRFWHEPD